MFRVIQNNPGLSGQMASVITVVATTDYQVVYYDHWEDGYDFDPEDPNNPGSALWPALGGLRNDMGAYGGPGAVNWWPSPAGGPIVTGLSVTPPSVADDGTLTLEATGEIR